MTTLLRPSGCVRLVDWCQVFPNLRRWLLGDLEGVAVDLSLLLTQQAQINPGRVPQPAARNAVKTNSILTDSLVLVP